MSLIFTSKEELTTIPIYRYGGVHVNDKVDPKLDLIDALEIFRHGNNGVKEAHISFNGILTQKSQTGIPNYRDRHFFFSLSVDETKDVIRDLLRKVKTIQGDLTIHEILDLACL